MKICAWECAKNCVTLKSPNCTCTANHRQHIPTCIFVGSVWVTEGRCCWKPAIFSTSFRYSWKWDERDQFWRNGDSVLHDNKIQCLTLCDTVEKKVWPYRDKTELWHCDRRVGVWFLSGGLALQRSQIPNQSVSEALSWGVKWPGREALHLPPIRCRAQECMGLCCHSSTHLRRSESLHVIEVCRQNYSQQGRLIVTVQQLQILLVFVWRADAYCNGVWLKRFASFSMDHDGYCEAGDTGHVVISHMWQCYAGLFVWVTGYLILCSAAG